MINTELLTDVSWGVGRELTSQIRFPISEQGLRLYMHLPSHKDINLFYDIGDGVEETIKKC